MRWTSTRGRWVFACAGLVLAAVQTAHASVLLATTGQVGFSQRGNASPGVPYTSALLAIGMDDTDPNNGLFADIPQNATGIFQADASTYPTAFPLFAAKITNGVSNTFYLYNGFNTPSQLLTGFTSGPEGPPLGIFPAVDLNGYTLTHVRQIINSFTLGPGTLNGGDSTAVSFNVTYQFWGEVVPAPSTGALALVGGCVLARRRRRG